MTLAQKVGHFLILVVTIPVAVVNTILLPEDEQDIARNMYM